MSVTGQRGISHEVFYTSLLNASTMTLAELNNPQHPVNNRVLSGKQNGARVHLLLDDGSSVIATAQGDAPDSTWKYTVSSASGGQVRKKMEVHYSSLSVSLDTAATKLIGIIEPLTPTSGALNEFFNQASQRLNVYNDDATLFFKMNVKGTWNVGSSNPNAMQLIFGDGLNGNIITSLKTSGTDADVLQFISYLSIDKDGNIAMNGSDMTIKVLDSDFTITDIFITLEQWTSQTTINPA